MGSYADFALDDGRSIIGYENGVDSFALIAFSHGDRATSTELAVGYDDKPYERTVVTYRAPAHVLGERFDLFGLHTSHLADIFDVLVNDRLDTVAEIWEGLIPLGDDQLLDDLAAECTALSLLSWDSWLALMAEAINRGDQIVRHEPGPNAVHSAAWLARLWDECDSRYLLRAVVETVDPLQEIVLDLSNLVEGGWWSLDPVDPLDEARAVASSLTCGLPPIVLTEGVFDVEVLSSAIEIRRPHLVGYIRFPDFNLKPKGGAPALWQTVRAFAASGIPNRVVALFDNDAAARDVTRQATTTMLPRNVTVVHLPYLGLAASYPTLDAGIESTEDVNGCAVSIEMFLGTDVLQAGGRLSPVVWGNTIAGVNNRQGEVRDKSKVQKAFRAKVRAARCSPGPAVGQDWSSIDLLLDHIIEAITNLG